MRACRTSPRLGLAISASLLIEKIQRLALRAVRGMVNPDPIEILAVKRSGSFSAVPSAGRALPSCWPSATYISVQKAIITCQDMR
jgi:hypothetical protein